MQDHIELREGCMNDAGIGGLSESPTRPRFLDVAREAIRRRHYSY